MSIHIGTKIKSIFQKSGLSVSEFARRIRTTRQNIYGIFERSSIDTALLERISNALNYNFFQHFVDKLEEQKGDSKLPYKPKKQRMVLHIEVDGENQDEILKLALGDDAKEFIKKALK